MLKTISKSVTAAILAVTFAMPLPASAISLDRIQTTTSSHHRVAVVEVMGRDAGWVAAWGGLAGGADTILVPEQPVDAADDDEQQGDEVECAHDVLSLAVVRS